MINIELDQQDKKEMILQQIEATKARERYQRISLAMLETPDDPQRWEIPKTLKYPSSKCWKKAGVFGLITQFLP